MLLLFSFYSYLDPLVSPSFPTRRSSDLKVSIGRPACIRLALFAGKHSLWRSSFTRDEVNIPSHPGKIGTEGDLLSIGRRSEEHTSELQSHSDLVCRLLLEKKKKDK